MVMERYAPPDMGSAGTRGDRGFPLVFFPPHCSRCAGLCRGPKLGEGLGAGERRRYTP